MTRTEAAEIARQREALSALPSTHELSALQRAAQARLRRPDARGYRERETPLARFAADFARVFGGR